MRANATRSKGTVRGIAAALALCVFGAPAVAQDPAYPPGVTAEVHDAVQRGLQWLSKNQANDGSWRNSGGYGSYPAAMTGLAGMAFIAGGSTPTRGRLSSSCGGSSSSRSRRGRPAAYPRADMLANVTSSRLFFTVLSLYVYTLKLSETKRLG